MGVSCQQLSFYPFEKLLNWDMYNPQLNQGKKKKYAHYIIYTPLTLICKGGKFVEDKGLLSIDLSTGSLRICSQLSN